MHSDDIPKLTKMKIEVTDRCPLRCVHCSSSATQIGRQTMQLCDFQRIASEAIGMGVREIAISGGEPLVWHPLAGSIEWLTDAGVRTCLYTSGSLPEARRLLEELASRGLGRVIFSIYADTAEQHDRVTQVPGSHSRVLDAMQAGVQLGMMVEAHFVPVRGNFAELQAVVERVTKMGVARLSLLRFVPQGRGADGNRLSLTQEQNVELRGTVKALRADGHCVRLGSPYNFLGLQDPVICSSGDDGPTVLPNFQIVPCDAFKGLPPSSLGLGSEFSKLDQHSLQECWSHSPYLKAVRELRSAMISSDCRECPSFSRCRSGCVAQKLYAHSEQVACRDPMCLRASVA